MTLAPILEAAKDVQAGDLSKYEALPLKTRRRLALLPHIKLDDGNEVPATADALDKFLSTMDNPDEWRMVKDPESGEMVKLTKDELEIIRRLKEGEYGDAEFEEYEPWVDFFTKTVQVMPINAAPEPKRRFQPSKWEAQKVAKIVKAIRRGLIIPKSSKADEKRVWYDIWSADIETPKGLKEHIAAPKIKLPEHSESYNPPEEYILTPEEEAAWNAQDPEDRSLDYLPKCYGSLRKVPAYDRFIQERFSRCLDLYMCPRAIKNKIQMNPDDLLPVLPDPRDLKPFPTTKSLEFLGHADGSSLTALSIDPTGQWLLSGSTDFTIRLWEVETGRCLQVWSTGEEAASSLAWNPNKGMLCFAAAIGSQLSIIVPLKLAGRETVLETIAAFAPSDKKSVLSWKADLECPEGRVLTIRHSQRITQTKWHRRGDYFATLAPEASGDSQKSIITMHQLSTRQSQWPFQKMPGTVRAIAFHTSLPHFIITTSKAVRIYDLVGQQLVKKLSPGLGSGSLGTLAVHPSGDHLLVGAFDGRSMWYDLDASSKPYRQLQSHQQAIRSISIHPTHPLFASASDDGTVQVVHAQVYQDLMQNPTIVPVKILRGFEGPVSRCEFHPVQPWLFCASKNVISLYVSQ